MELSTLVLALTAGHLLGDFVVQSEQMAAKKMQSIAWLWLHIFQVAGFTWFLLGSLHAAWIVGAVSMLHFLTDMIRIAIVAAFARRHNTDNPRISRFTFRMFLLDQVIHAAVIAGIGYVAYTVQWTGAIQNIWFSLFGIRYVKGMLLLCGMAASVWGAGYAMKLQMVFFSPAATGSGDDGLPRGGRIIGMLERMLIFIFVLAGKPEGAGFLIAAKSVFRIGDLTHKEDRHRAEYIMIGTLFSFTYAIIIAYITQWFMGKIC